MAAPLFATLGSAPLALPTISGRTGHQCGVKFGGQVFVSPNRHRPVPAAHSTSLYVPFLKWGRARIFPGATAIALMVGYSQRSDLTDGRWPFGLVIMVALAFGVLAHPHGRADYATTCRSLSSRAAPHRPPGCGRCLRGLSGFNAHPAGMCGWGTRPSGGMLGVSALILKKEILIHPGWCVRPRDPFGEHPGDFLQADANGCSKSCHHFELSGGRIAGGDADVDPGAGCLPSWASEFRLSTGRGRNMEKSAGTR